MILQGGVPSSVWGQVYVSQGLVHDWVKNGMGDR